MRVGAIDCGTNSIRLLVADVDPGAGHKHDLHREMRVVRLGQGVDRSGVLSGEALERTRFALSDYAGLCRRLQVDALRMIATSATRDAGNRSIFVEMVRQTLGQLPEVVSGDEEAALSFDGATRELDDRSAPFLVVDIGGGSTEFVLGGRTVEAARSVDVGCVRLTERHLRDDPPTAAQVAAAQADVDAALEDVRAAVPVERTRTAIGVAGSVTTVAAVALGLPSYDPRAIHGSRLSADQVAEVTGGLLAMTRAQRAALPVMHPGRVDVIGAGALVLRTVVDRLGLTEVVVSETDILDGIAWSTAARETA